jgi:hypothetical protein
MFKMIRDLYLRLRASQERRYWLKIANERKAYWHKRYSSEPSQHNLLANTTSLLAECRLDYTRRQQQREANLRRINKIYTLNKGNN